MNHQRHLDLTFISCRVLSRGCEGVLISTCLSQGAVQGPEEFAEGFVIGVRSLLGHTVGKAVEELFISFFMYIK